MNMLRKYTLTVIAIFCLLPLFAQTKDSVAYKLKIDEVEIVAKRIQHANTANIGAKVTNIEPAQLNLNRTRSLSELLVDNSAIYIKSLGVGALSTASFRGGSASQTRVNWNGINITPPMSGFFDFSQFPVFFADNVDLYYGSSHTKNGTGAVTGSVNIFNTPDWNRGFTGKVFGEYGSYNTYTGGTQLNYSNSKVSTKTRLYYQNSDNNYSYMNKVLTNTPFREKREDAEYHQWGVMQEGYFKLNRHSQLTAIGWIQQVDRMLPQPLGIVGKTHEEQKETNLRGYLGYDFVKGKHALNLKAAYLYYKLEYDKRFDSNLFDPEGSTNSSKTLQTIADYTFAPTDKLILNTTFTYTHDFIDVSSYIKVDSSKYHIGGIDFKIPEAEPPLTHHRNIYSWQTSGKWLPAEWLQLNLQYMFEHNDGKSVSTASLGYATNFLDRTLYFKGNVAYNYRFPSMNDKYWRPGGNPDVKPEHGYSYDMTLGYEKQLNRQWHLSTEVSGYLMHIDDWILWLPKDGNQWIWTPQNKRDVLSTGVEWKGKIQYQLKDLKLSAMGNVSWSQAHTSKKQHKDDGSYLQQIPYVPIIKGNGHLNGEYRGIFCTWQTTFIGKRYITTDESYSTRPYIVHNLLMGVRRDLKCGVRITPQLRIDNLFNQYYESTQYYPMPLRNVLASVMVEF